MLKAVTSNRMRTVRRIHFIGIGGVGMSGIAHVLRREGYQVSGSDLHESAMTKSLAELGITIFIGHAAENVAGANVVVYSSAVDDTNPEVQAAKAAGLPLIPRAQMLAELMRFRYGIAIAGTHGKTTTTSLITSVFAAADLDPTYVIGGKLNSAQSNARLGAGEYLIAEADESDASFLYLHPMLVVVTNIDADHMKTYHGDFKELEDAFIEFIHTIPFYGCAVLCIDDPVIARLLPRIHRPVVTYGFDEKADLRVQHYRVDGFSGHFECIMEGQSYAIRLNMPGRHNALNALATIAIARHEGIEMSIIQDALSKFGGVGRRFQRYPVTLKSGKSVTLVDDYGHHPTELRATIATTRETWPDRRLVMVFQPHRYTRTHDLFDDFVTVLCTCDQVLLLDVYSAGEPAIPGADSHDLMRAIRAKGTVEPIYIPSIAEVQSALETVCQDNDIVMMQGAGNIGALVQQCVQDLGEPHEDAKTSS
jgi:UDP-N-acetylmuramate--alanine ligase